MTNTHTYQLHITWMGNLGKGTHSYTSYSRDHEINAAGKLHPIKGASDPSFRGDPSRYNPEELLVSTLSTCHMLWYLHLCSINGIHVVSYEDSPVGTMIEEADGAGQFEKVVLHPAVEVEEEDRLDLAHALHEQAHKKCFIARSVNFEVSCEAKITVAQNN